MKPVQLRLLSMDYRHVRYWPNVVQWQNCNLFRSANPVTLLPFSSIVARGYKLATLMCVYPQQPSSVHVYCLSLSFSYIILPFLISHCIFSFILSLSLLPTITTTTTSSTTHPLLFWQPWCVWVHERNQQRSHSFWALMTLQRLAQSKPSDLSLAPESQQLLRQGQQRQPTMLQQLPKPAIAEV